MARKLILIAWLATMSLGMAAQLSVEQRINVIHQDYAERLNLMQNQPYDDDSDAVERLTVTYNRMYPGTGMARFTDTYYWSDDENEEYMLKPTLYYVTSSYTMNSGLYRFNREYLFDALTEEPMFIYVTTQVGDDGKRQEYRFYFDKGKLIRQIPEKIMPVNDDELNPEISVDKNGRAVVSSLLGEFKKIKSRFHDIIPTYAW